MERSTGSATPDQVVRPLLRVRQVREFTDRPVDREQLDAILQAARWSGSSSNGQPWRFIRITDAATLRALAEAGHPQARGLLTAPAAIAIVLPEQPDRNVMNAYDEGRATERMLVAATMLGLGAGISWITSAARPRVREILGLPQDRFVRTLVGVGEPTAAARTPKSAPGQARLPFAEVVLEERWPEGRG